MLTDNGVKVTPIRGAGAGGATFTFPIVDGNLDATTLAGTIEHRGGLQFAAGSRRLRVQDVIIDTRASVAAAALNKTFRVSLFEDGLDIGVAKVTARV